MSMSTQTLPKISIIMPVLNRESTIEKAILSLLDQHYPNLEFIVIDGGSTDNTIALIKKYEQDIAYWHSKPDRGPAHAINLGIEKATGELVALLMADDWYAPNTLNKIGQTLLAHPEADMITCAGRIVLFDDQAHCYRVKHCYATPRRMALNFTNVCFDITSAICCRFIRKSLYDQIGVFIYFDSQGEYRLSNDKEFLLRAILHGAKDKFISHIGHNYLASKASSTFGNHKKNILRLCYEHMEIAETYLQTKPLSRHHRFLLKYWYNDQVTRLVLYYLLDGKFREAKDIAQTGLRKYKVFWLGAFIFTTQKIVLKKIFRLLRALTKMMGIHRSESFS